MDEIDRKIVDYLKENGKGTSGEIAKAVGVNRSTANRHLKYLGGLGEVDEFVDKGHSAWRIKVKEKAEKVEDEYLPSDIDEYTNRAWLIIPKQFNDGTPIPDETLERYKAEVREHCGGWTVFESTSGEYVSPKYGVIRDKNDILLVCFKEGKKEENRDFLRKLASEIGRELEQESVIVIFDPGGTEFIPADSSPHPPEFVFKKPYGLQDHFTGRYDEQALLEDWVYHDSENNFLFLRAFGGTGKSSLVWHWLTTVFKKRPSRYLTGLWWSFYEEKANFQNFLEYAVNKLSFGRKSIQNFTFIDQGKKKVSYTEMQDYVQDSLREKTFLLILDGMERTTKAYRGRSHSYDFEKLEEILDEDRECIDPQLTQFLKFLANPAVESKTLAAGRLVPRVLDGLMGVRIERLGNLKPEDALDFMKNSGIRGSDEEINNVCSDYWNYALSLRTLAGALRKNPIKPGHISLAPKVDPYQDQESKLYRVFDEMRSSLSSEPEIWRLLEILSAMRGAFDFETMKLFIGDKDDKWLERVVQNLIDRDVFLCSVDEDTGVASYDFHPHIRSYIYDRIANLERTHELLRVYFESVPIPSVIESLDDLQPVIELYHHTVGAERYDEAFSLLRNRLTPEPIYYRFGASHLGIELLTALFPKEGELPRSSDESNQAWACNEIANYYSISGQPRRAVSLFEMHNKLREKTENKRSLAIGLGNLAYMAQIQIGDLESAESNLRRAIELDPDIENEGYADVHYLELGRMKAYIGSFNESNDDLHIAQEAFDKLGPSHTNYVSVVKAYRALHALFMNDLQKALKFATQSIEFAEITEKVRMRVPRDFIRANWLIGASYIAMEKPNEAEKPLNFAITECRKINLVEREADILLSLAKLHHLQKKDDESLKLATEAFEIANRCGYVLQQADIHLFLAEFFKDASDIDKAKEHAELAKLRSHQMIDVETGDYITNPEDTVYKYKPCYDKAMKFLKELNG